VRGLRSERRTGDVHDHRLRTAGAAPRSRIHSVRSHGPHAIRLDRRGLPRQRLKLPHEQCQSPLRLFGVRTRLHSVPVRAGRSVQQLIKLRPQRQGTSRAPGRAWLRRSLFAVNLAAVYRSRRSSARLLETVKEGVVTALPCRLSRAAAVRRLGRADLAPNTDRRHGRSGSGQPEVNVFHKAWRGRLGRDEWWAGCQSRESNLRMAKEGDRVSGGGIAVAPDSSPAPHGSASSWHHRIADGLPAC
jgi:hypothetical protein